MRRQSDSRRNFKLVLEYDGLGYHGWQRQHGVLTLQEVLESRLEVMLGGPIRVRASGRTDAGVHARGQVVNFTSRTLLRPQDILRGVNSLLPPDVVVLEAQEVPDSFHARFSAVSKTYEYHVLNRPVPSALERGVAWHIRQPLDCRAMRVCLDRLIGLHDFSAFMAAGSSVTSTERHLFRAALRQSNADWLIFSFEANGFLRHMVRNLVGTLVDAGRGKTSPEEFSTILADKDRRRAGMTAPAHGLVLVAVHYQPDLEKVRGYSHETRSAGVTNQAFGNSDDQCSGEGFEAAGGARHQLRGG